MTPPARTSSAARRIRRSCASTGCSWMYSAMALRCGIPTRADGSRTPRMTIYAAVCRVHPRFLGKASRIATYAGSHRLGAARGVLPDLSAERPVPGHRGAHGRHAGAARGRLVAGAAHPAAARLVGAAGADLRRGDAAAAHPPVHPVEADGTAVGGERRLHRELMDRGTHAHRAAARAGARGGGPGGARAGGG